MSIERLSGGIQTWPKYEMLFADKAYFDLPASLATLSWKLGAKLRYEKCRLGGYPNEQVAFIVPPNAEPSSPL
jgi:hypothetical protein